MLEAQAVANKQAQKQAVPNAEGGVSVPAGPDDDLELDEDSERRIAEAGQALLEAKRAAAAGEDAEEAARKVAAAKRVLREQMTTVRAKKQRVRGRRSV